MKKFCDMKKFYDKFIYVIVIIGPLSNVPQLLKIWTEKSSSGVSSVSWLFFSIVSLSWLVYGVLHKDKHLIIMNSALVVIQGFVAFGAMIYS